MRKIIVLLFAVALWNCTCNSQSEVIEGLSISSKILGKNVNYSVYLPKDYKSSSRSYPVLYLLHGYTDNETAWVQFGQINTIADKLIENGEIAPMIIIMPDGGVSFYINSYNGSVRYEDMFFQEFIPQIEKSYRVRSKKEFRAIAGLSMGGYGTLQYALKHSEMFSACAPMSPAVLTDKEAMKRIKENSLNFADLFGPITGDTLPSAYQKNSVLKLVENLPKEQMNSVRYYIDCGDKDFLIEGVCDLHIAMINKGVTHEFRVREGEHNWPYWRSSIVEGLKFISSSFHR